MSPYYRTYVRLSTDPVTAGRMGRVVDSTLDWPSQTRDQSAVDGDDLTVHVARLVGEHEQHESAQFGGCAEATHRCLHRHPGEHLLRCDLAGGFGVDETGGDGVEADVLARQLGGEADGERVHPCLGHRVEAARQP